MNSRTLKAYFEMTKPSILFLVLITTLLGYYLGAKGQIGLVKAIKLLIGTAFVCGGSAVLNHYLEREYDSLMKRTKNRPIPSGIVKPDHALGFGIMLTFIGVAILYVEINILTAFLSLVTTFLYVLVYTPMKRASWLNTSFGAIPGAMPPLGGWAAATGHLNFDAGILFLILFIWQHPHFYAIAWMCRDDYERGGFQMLPVVEPDGKKMFQQILFYSFILIPVSVVPFFTGLSSYIYFIGALSIGILLLLTSRKFAASHSMTDARQLLKATVFYLPVLLVLIIVDQIIL